MPFTVACDHFWLLSNYTAGFSDYQYRVEGGINYTIELCGFIFFYFFASSTKLSRVPFSYGFFPLSDRCYHNYKVIVFLFLWQPYFEKQLITQMKWPINPNSSWQYGVKWIKSAQESLSCAPLLKSQTQVTVSKYINNYFFRFTIFHHIAEWIWFVQHVLVFLNLLDP